MNLYFRLIWILLRYLGFEKPSGEMQCRTPFRAWPLDCDINLHLTNARYLSFMDLARTHLIISAGIFGKLRKNAWLPVAGACEIRYFKSIKPLQRFEVITELVGWDEKYWYVEQRFESPGKLHARALIRGVFVGGGKVIPVQDAVALMDHPTQSHLTPLMLAWKELLAVKE